MIERNKLLILLAVAIFLLSLVYSISRLSEDWAYQGIEYHPLSSVSFASIVFLLIIPALRFKSKIEKPSDLVVIYLYFFVYAPYIIVPFVIIDQEEMVSEFYLYSITLLLCFFIFQSPSRDKKSFIEYVPVLTPKAFYLLLSGMYVVSLILLVNAFGFSLKSINLTEVYDIRVDYKEVKQNESVIIGYIVPWFAYIINPFVLLLGMIKKDYRFIFVAILFQLYIFTFSAFKSHLAIIILEVLLYLYFRNRRHIRASIIFIVLGFFPLIIIVLDYLFFNDNLLSMLITRRVIVVPGQLSYYYIEFFTNNPKNYLSYSVFKNFIPNPYTLNPPFLIGREYFGRETISANAGFLPDSFASFGLLGVLGSAFIIKWVLNTIDFLYRSSKNNNIILVLTLAFCYVLNTSALLTLFLTHGLLLLILLFRIFPWKAFKVNSL